MTLQHTRHNHAPRPPLRWMTRAACQDADPGLFFPVIGDTSQQGQADDQARRICQACPVQPACLDWALRTGEPDGLWGGTTPEERRRLRAREQQAPATA
ncbi:WhiB family transcriptional regulator [Nonomuraea rubra]|uniref:Transcriptional regulator WhiB n=2 Tax=Nonomuraea rubra TaxID=46180 RepID=A0A7X0NVH5_9ACTN|nr:WhiB family redox-sensing transcriptional regulator [Nonomuraea rubra]